MDCGLYQQTAFRRAAGCEFRPGGLRLTEELAAACRVGPQDRVLDLACGVGSTAAYLASTYGARVTGLDSSTQFLEEASRRGTSVEWVSGSAQAMPFPQRSFDVVFAECFLSGCADRLAVLREINRVLRPGGRLAVTDMYLREPDIVPRPSVPPSTCLSGAQGREATIATLVTEGFHVLVWEDRSDDLTALAASLIMEYGSSAAFWEAAGGNKATGAALAAARPGYYMLVAQAPGRDRRELQGV